MCQTTLGLQYDTVELKGSMLTFARADPAFDVVGS